MTEERGGEENERRWSGIVGKKELQREEEKRERKKKLQMSGRKVREIRVVEILGLCERWRIK